MDKRTLFLEMIDQVPGIYMGDGCGARDNCGCDYYDIEGNAVINEEIEEEVA